MVHRFDTWDYTQTPRIHDTSHRPDFDSWSMHGLVLLVHSHFTTRHLIHNRTYSVRHWEEAGGLGPSSRAVRPKGRPVPMSMANRFAFSKLRNISSGGSVMLLSKLWLLFSTRSSSAMVHTAEPRRWLRSLRARRRPITNKDPWPARRSWRRAVQSQFTDRSN